MREAMRPQLSRLTTIRLGGEALALLEPETRDDLANLAVRAKEIGGELFFLGRGSNLLFRDGVLPLVPVRLNAFRKIRICGEDGETLLVEAEAGASLAALLRFCLSSGLSGLEGLAGIPGSVGGACAMNAGSFGSETGKCIHSIEAWDEDDFRIFHRNNLNFAYRSLKISECAALPLIYKAIFALTRRPKSVILQCVNLNYLKKKSRQPLGAWSAGCAFRNPPEGPSAGRLLEEAGMRGRRLGGMVFSPVHANFLVNEGSGTSAQALELLAIAAGAVKRNSGTTLEPEIRIIP